MSKKPRQDDVRIIEGDNLASMSRMKDASFHLIYADPPFNTGTTRTLVSMRTVQDPDGDRTGFQGKRYKSEVTKKSSYADSYSSYKDFLVPRLEQAHRLLTPNGSLFLHLDYREVHYAKVWLDAIFGRECFINEIIWAYDYGARSKKRWPTKHDNILWYAKDPNNYVFNYDEIDRIPYMAPGLVGPEKAERGKTLTDTWWHTIVSPTGKEKTGYPTQKPLGILRRIVRVHSHPGDTLLDFFAGSGSFGEAALELRRHVVLLDSNHEAIEVMHNRLRRQGYVC